ncbi:1-phosphatidylinositol 4,5-bisphosphate phosphodiesterase delta-4-like isoform X4 [Lampetra fluviatilis]
MFREKSELPAFPSWRETSRGRLDTGGREPCTRPMAVGSLLPDIQGGLQSRVMDITVDDDLSRMLLGASLCKIKSKTWKKQRLFKLQEDFLTIWYESKKSNKSKATFSVVEIEAVREGHQSEVLQSSAGEFPPERCFTIVFRGRRGNLDLVAESEEEAQRWADKNKDGRMTFKEVKNLLKMMNIDMNEHHAQHLFEMADMSRSGTLEGIEFVVFYKLLTQRDELQALFSSLSGDGSVLSRGELAAFLRDFQREEGCEELRFAEELASAITEKHELSNIARSLSVMTLDGFVRYLTSPDGSLWDQRHDSIGHDMTRPLSHYFISSSHNTYLMEDQLRGPSSTEAYIRAFRKGCRCVELDCWDGQNGEPVIYHGHTLTSKILFSDVIRTIEKYAFQVSDYPVILSIENHCSVAQQAVLARHMQSILGDKLLTAPLAGLPSSQLPSPEQLRGKVLVKGKRLPGPWPRETVPVVNGHDESGEVSDEDEAAEMEDESVRNSVRQRGKKCKQNLSVELSNCVVYCRSVQFPGFSRPRDQASAWDVSSFTETKARKLLREDGNEFVRHNSLQLSRVYPAGRRTDSSNFNPQEFWNVGCQIVALNFQTAGDEMDLHDGHFRQNGGCGYVLKPAFLCDPTTAFQPENPQPGTGLHTVRLTIKVISGQQLPKVPHSNKGSIIDPLVRVEVHGVPLDNARYETKYIDNNGFNPQWNEILSFNINVPEVALLRFVVEDHDTATPNDFVAQYSIAFSSLRQGYRHIPLLSRDGTRVEPSSLFIHVKIADVTSQTGRQTGKATGSLSAAECDS